jgi:3-hydroxyisobutyrate dehydrogenase-like beta-hydroxyacid dehydrogenase
MPVNQVSEQAGDAALRKLLRSVMMKGLAGCVIEALRGAEQAGCAEWLWDNLADEITRADARILSRLVRGSGPHAVRRLHEMEAALAMLQELGVEPIMTRATVENLRHIPQQGLPQIPLLPD